MRERDGCLAGHEAKPQALVLSIAMRVLGNLIHCVLLLVLATPLAGQDPTPELDVVERAIEHHGGEIYRGSETELDVCSKSGCFHVVARADGDRFEYTVSGKSGEDQLEVRSSNDALEVSRNGEAEVVAAGKEQRYRDWAMARVYFCFLPYRLGDDSVHRQDLGLVDWNGRRLHKVKVTFETGTSTDAGDEYMYWFDPDTARLESFAYSYDSGGGGIRFRHAIQHRRIGGVLFFDQETSGWTVPACPSTRSIPPMCATRCGTSPLCGWRRSRYGISSEFRPLNQTFTGLARIRANTLFHCRP